MQEGEIFDFPFSIFHLKHETYIVRLIVYYHEEYEEQEEKILIFLHEIQGFHGWRKVRCSEFAAGIFGKGLKRSGGYGNTWCLLNIIRVKMGWVL